MERNYLSIDPTFLFIRKSSKRYQERFSFCKSFYSMDVSIKCIFHYMIVVKRRLCGNLIYTAVISGFQRGAYFSP
ncbi:hypothetical protein BV917_04235 [Leptospira santarosai serovar Guaricura]|nr:hypothetical protein BV917_04235 [Leptospira santarosai serovar Guaricura]